MNGRYAFYNAALAGTVAFAVFIVRFLGGIDWPLIGFVFGGIAVSTVVLLERVLGPWLVHRHAADLTQWRAESEARTAEHMAGRPTTTVEPPTELAERRAA